MRHLIEHVLPEADLARVGPNLHQEQVHSAKKVAHGLGTNNFLLTSSKSSCIFHLKRNKSNGMRIQAILCLLCRKVFNCVKRNFTTALILHCYALCLAEKSRATFSEEVKPKPIVTCPHTFSCAWRRLHVFGSSSICFTEMSAPVVIGLSNYFGFGLLMITFV